MSEIAIWMMTGGGIVAVFAIIAILGTRRGVDRGDLTKPLAIVGLGAFLVELFIYYQWGSY